MTLAPAAPPTVRARRLEAPEPVRHARAQAETTRWPTLAVSAELPAPAEPPRSTDSAALLQGARKLLISHAGEVYTLHLTRQNKLLLTK